MSYLQKAFARQTTVFKNGQYSIGDRCYVGETADEMAAKDASIHSDTVNEDITENSDATIFDNFSGTFFTGMQNDVDSILKQYGEDSDSEN